MPMVTFARLVVVTHDGLPILTKVQPVLESVRAVRLDLWQPPNLALQNAIVLQNCFGIKDYPSLAQFVVVFHTIVMRKTLVYEVRGYPRNCGRGVDSLHF